MRRAALNGSLREIALARLDRLIAEVKHFPAGQSDLLLEHLQSARIYLLGAMPHEYEFSLLAAKQTGVTLTDAALRSHVAQELGVLLDQMPTAEAQTRLMPSNPPRDAQAIEEGNKSELYRFFHGAATKLGVFYPTHYIFASFPSFENARNAARALQAIGHRESVAASAAETFRFINEIRSDTGVWGALMASLSRFFGTEEVFADIDLAEAEKGSGFLAVYCPQEEQAVRIRDLVLPFEPLAMQLYLRDGIQSLLAGKSPGPQGNHLR
jgi:hypothetical protein